MDILLLKRELEEDHKHRESVEAENSELKGKLDSEVKGTHKLMEKV